MGGLGPSIGLGDEGKGLPSPPPQNKEIQEKYFPANIMYKKLSYCWETVRRESMPRIAEMDLEMTT